jgi:hypothetical protein
VLEIGWLPLLLILAVLLLPWLAVHYLVADQSPADTAATFDLSDFIQLGIVALCLGSFALRWYRLTLPTDPRASPRQRVAIWLRFMAYTMAAYSLIAGFVAAIILAAPFSEGDEPAAVAARMAVAVAVTALMLVVTRLSLLFPATASGARLGARAAWRVMRGNSWRLVGANVMAVMPIVLFRELLASVLIGAKLVSPDDAAADSPLGLVLLGGVVYAVLGLLMTALGASILSEFYRRIMRAEIKGG